ncbi:hypothetical protein QR77_04170 [Streptomyces sp. 150FB]|uniref:SRPBCC family protein n=1 Tax=Streptomyces sp. 150FB TaxID=1576605 RepID=UPI0005890E03|nr:SRPBCC family protein [Streptomyces sp. 150FB]KIF73385.1 hypothetical protein QR77_04170 [Streptomyces sp. 150FB]
MPKTDQMVSEIASMALDRLRKELSRYVSGKVEQVAGKAGDKLTNVTEKLTNVAENGGKPSAPDSSSDDADPDSGQDGGGTGIKAGDPKVTSVIEVLDVGVPLRTAYDHWTQYEDFSDFTKGVRDVSSDEDGTTQWHTKIAFSNRNFEATVQEQVPDDRIVWTSEGAKGTTKGAVSFHELTPTLTRIVLVIEYTPAGFFEKTGNLWRAQGRRIRLDFKHFQRYVTLTDEDPEGWRGEIRDGEVVRTHEEAMDEEERDEDDDREDDNEDGEDDNENENDESDGDEDEDDEDK